MDRLTNRVTKICLLHSTTALCAGSLFYIFMRRHTYLHAILGIPGTGWQLSISVTGWLGDFLWSYALCFALYWIWQDARKGVVAAALLTVALGAGLEMLQKVGAISGTFDIWDIFAEAVAALTTAIIIKRSIKK